MTGHLKSFLEQGLPAARRALVAKAPQPIRMERAVARFASFGAGALSMEDADARLRQVVATFDAGGPSALTSRLVRNGCILYFHGAAGPASNDALARALVERVEQLTSHMGLSALIDAFLDSSVDQESAAGRLLSRLAPLAARWPWREWDPRGQALQRFRLLDLEQAPGLIAAHVLGNPKRPVTDCLADASLTTPARQQGRLATMAFAAAAQTVAETRGAGATGLQSRLMDWARLTGDPLAYPTKWTDYANALLLPWQTAAPPAEHGNTLRSTLIGYGGDPRINKARWIAVHRDALRVLMRWLTQNSFRMFFDLVSRHLTERTDMWEDRRAYWERYLKQNHVDEAWVVLGQDLAVAAERLYISTKDPSFRMFGLLDHRGRRSPQHAALIMRIDILVVVEWSHNGKWNMWMASDGEAPKLYRMSELPLSRRVADYHASHLMDGNLADGIHDAGGGWKHTVQWYIKHHTNRTLK